MLGKNLLWVAKQHGHSVEVMLRMYAAWLEGATEADISRNQTGDANEDPFAGPPARCLLCNFRCKFCKYNRMTQIVIRPPESPEFGSSLAVENGARSKPLNRVRDKVAERVGFEPTETPIEISKFMKNLRLRVPRNPLALPTFGSRFGIGLFRGPPNR